MLQNERQPANTRQKLRLLEEMYGEAAADTDGDEEVREAELHSLRQFINQFKEEVARYEARQPVRR